MRNRWVFMLWVALIVVPLAGVAHAAEETPTPQAAQTAAPVKPPQYDVVGAPLPPLELTVVGGGKTVKFEKFEKPALLLFINSSCTACRAEVNFFGKILEKQKGKVDAYAVSVDFDPSQTVRRFPRLSGDDFTLLDGSDFAFAKALGFDYTPATVIISKDGKQAFRKGGFSEKDMELMGSELMKQIQ